MIILPFLQFFFYNGYIFYIFIFTFLFGIIFSLIRRHT